MSIAALRAGDTHSGRFPFMMIVPLERDIGAILIHRCTYSYLFPLGSSK